MRTILRVLLVALIVVAVGLAIIRMTSASAGEALGDSSVTLLTAAPSTTASTSTSTTSTSTTTTSSTTTTTAAPTTTTTTSPPVTAPPTTVRRPTPTTTAAPRPAPTTTAPPSSGGGVNAFLVCVRQRESGGNYHAVNPSSGAGGAYQFMPSTWRAMGGSGLPQNASPAVQDAMAMKLYATAGRSPWAGGQYAC